LFTIGCEKTFYSFCFRFLSQTKILEINWVKMCPATAGKIFYPGSLKCMYALRGQCCQIFLGTRYQNRKKWSQWTQNVPNGHKVSHMFLKCSKWP
jgi:hypothetical protein